MTQEKTISTYYAADHDRLDDLFKKFQSSKQSDIIQAKRYFEEFKLGLERHIVWEEKILFPVFEEKTGFTDSGPTVVMRIEHEEIKEALERIHKKISAGNTESDLEEDVLLAVLSVHNRKEEDILYPLIDSVTSPADKTAVFQEMKKWQDFSAPVSNEPCGLS